MRLSGGLDLVRWGVQGPQYRPPQLWLVRTRLQGFCRALVHRRPVRWVFVDDPGLAPVWGSPALRVVQQQRAGGPPGPAHGRCEASPGARAFSGRGVLRLKLPGPGEPSPCPAPFGRAARAGVYSKGLRGFSTRLAHGSGGPSQRPSTTPPLLPSPSTWPLSRLYAPPTPRTTSGWVAAEIPREAGARHDGARRTLTREQALRDRPRPWIHHPRRETVSGLAAGTHQWGAAARRYPPVGSSR